jgi:STE24 endopeptidase
MVDLPLTLRYTQLTAVDGKNYNATDTDNDDLFTTYAVFATIVFTLVVFFFETYLSLRQRSTYHKTTFPSELSSTVGNIDKESAKERAGKKKKEGEGEPKVEENGAADSNGDKKKKAVDRNAPLLPQLQEKFTAAQSYGLDKVNFSLVASTYGLIEGITFLLLGFLPYFWDYSVSLGSTYFGLTEVDNEIKISLIFIGVTTAVSLVTSLPFELYSTFQIERKHGFNKQTIGLFITDKIKGLGLMVVIGSPFVALLLKIIKWGGEQFYLYVWAFTFAFSLFMMTVYPVVIMPMFNKYEPLPEGSLKDQIYALAGQLKFPLTKLFVMDGSKRSSHSNAFMFGFFKNKRIVLFDTLMEQVHDDEILAILGHELGKSSFLCHLCHCCWVLGHAHAIHIIIYRCDEVILSPSDRYMQTTKERPCHISQFDNLG